MAAKRQVLEIPGLPRGQPFSHGVKIGNMIFTSGIDPIDPKTGKAGEGIERQAELVFQNLRTVLEAGGATPSNVAQVTVYMQDTGQRQAVNKQWLEMFPDEHDRPTRKAIQFDFGSGGILVQLQVIAVL